MARTDCRACEQAWMFGAHIVFAQRVAGLERLGDRLAVRLDDGHQVTARAVVAATGIAWRRLGVSRLVALVDADVFYGAAGSEARAMEGQDVFVVGAGNSAGQAALYLARYARQVTMLVRGDSLGRSMSDYLIREIEATASITVRLHTEVSDGDGAERLASLTLRDRRDGRAGPGDGAVRAYRGRAPADARGTGRATPRSLAGRQWPGCRPVAAIGSAGGGGFR